MGDRFSRIRAHTSAPHGPPHVIIEKFTFLRKFFPIIIFRKNAYFSTYRPKVLKAISPFNMSNLSNTISYHNTLSQISKTLHWKKSVNIVF